MVRWIEVQSDNVADLVDEERVLGELEGLCAMRLKRKGPPDSADRTLAQTTALGQRSRAPVRRVLGERLQGQCQVKARSTSSSLTLRGAPGRGSSVHPSRPLSRYRRRHLPTVGRLTRNSRAS